jgi:hypothetical protein
MVVILFIVFVFFGILIGYFTDFRLNGDEITPVDNGNGTDITQAGYTGKITYLDPSYYPGEDISHVLVDEEGNDIILLRSKEQILEVAEGLTATVYGVRLRTKSGEDVLLVKEVTITNAPN